MIIDTLQNANRYYKLHPLFEKAFAYIRETDLDATSPGKYEVDGANIKASFSNKPGMTAEESVASFECHDRNIDIQVCISGSEQMGWKPREGCRTPDGAYNPEKDVQHYKDKPDMFFTLSPGQFVIFFPEDVHAPMIGTGMIKKLVIKVKI